MAIDITVVRTIESLITETYTVDSLPERWDDMTLDQRFDAVSIVSTDRHDGDEEVQGTLRVHRVEVEN